MIFRGALYLAVLVSAGCFSPKYGSGHLKCEGQACPADYHCAADGTCWKNGSDPVLDLSATPSDAGPPDLSSSDGPIVRPDGFIPHKGDPCQPGDPCDTGHCVDGVC